MTVPRNQDTKKLRAHLIPFGIATVWGGLSYAYLGELKVRGTFFRLVAVVLSCAVPIYCVW